MTEEEKEPGVSHFTLFVGGLRFIFDLILLCVVLLCIGFIIFARNLERTQEGPVRAADGITVLTGGGSRIDEAMKLLANHKASRVLITGVYKKTTKAQLKSLASQGDQLFTCCVDLDYEARNTIDNATETAEWVAKHKYNSVIVVTSNYHMPRALAELGRAMPGVSLIPYSVVDNNVHLDRWWTYPGTAKLLVSEYLKYLPAVARLGATNLMRRALSGRGTVTAEDRPEP